MSSESFTVRVVSHLGRVLFERSSGSIESAKAAAATIQGDATIRGECTSDGTHWGVGAGRAIAHRENGKWLNY